MGRVAPPNGLSDHPKTCEQKNNEEESYINILGHVVDISCLHSNYQPLPSPPPTFFHNSKKYELLSNSLSVTACYPGSTVNECGILSLSREWAYVLRLSEFLPCGIGGAMKTEKNI